MTRTGECLRCGECCRWLGWFADADVPGTVEWAEARGLTVVDNGDGTLAIMLKYTCPHLVVHNAQCACALHGDDKPEVCRRFPTSRVELLPGCGFSFEDVE
jgi:Fe-S-cluster containining protein